MLNNRFEVYKKKCMDDGKQLFPISLKGKKWKKKHNNCKRRASSSVVVRDFYFFSLLLTTTSKEKWFWNFVRVKRIVIGRKDGSERGKQTCWKDRALGPGNSDSAWPESKPVRGFGRGEMPGLKQRWCRK